MAVVRVERGAEVAVVLGRFAALATFAEPIQQGKRLSVDGSLGVTVQASSWSAPMNHGAKGPWGGGPAPGRSQSLPPTASGRRSGDQTARTAGDVPEASRRADHRGCSFVSVVAPGRTGASPCSSPGPESGGTLIDAARVEAAAS